VVLLVSREFAHLRGDLILRHGFPAEDADLRGAVGDVTDFLGNIDFGNAPRGGTPKKQFRHIGGVKALQMFPISQTRINEAFRKALRNDRGWRKDPFALEDQHGVPILRLKGDFTKLRVLVEVEFGNVASLYRDLTKFHLAALARAFDVGVLIVPIAKLASFTDQGIATFELIERMARYLPSVVALPLLVLGVDTDDWDGVAVHYRRMRDVVRLNMPEARCHEFESVLAASGEPTVIEEEDPESDEDVSDL
jgi:hypothetical protein